MQYVDRAITFDNWLKENMNRNGHPIAAELPCILFQIYSVLATLSTAKAFTHYDLHTGNVLLYPVPEGTYVTMVYNNPLGGGDMSSIPPVIIKTRYIVKIIDYGRAYCPDNATIHSILCNAPACNGIYERHHGTRINQVHNKCGNDTGYNFFGNHSLEYDFYINRAKVNNAHDVKLLAMVIKYVYSNRSFYEWTRDPATAHIKHILKNANMSYFDHRNFVGSPNIVTGTTPDNFMIPFDEIHRTPGVMPPIKTVNEAYWALYNLVNTDAGFADAMEKQAQWLRPYGTLTIDLAFNMKTVRPMAFVKEGTGMGVTPTPAAFPSVSPVRGRARTRAMSSPVMSPMHLPTRAAAAAPPEMSPLNLPGWDDRGHDVDVLADISLSN
jgi:hypothetical protein